MKSPPVFQVPLVGARRKGVVVTDAAGRPYVLVGEAGEFVTGAGEFATPGPTGYFTSLVTGGDPTVSELVFAPDGNTIAVFVGF